MYTIRKTCGHWHIQTCFDFSITSKVYPRLFEYSFSLTQLQGNKEKNYPLANCAKNMQDRYIDKGQERKEREQEREGDSKRDNCVFALILSATLVNLQLFKMGLPISFNLRGENMLLQCSAVCVCVCVVIICLFMSLCTRKSSSNKICDRNAPMAAKLS